MCAWRRYEIPKRISGPILDSIDIHIAVPSIDYEMLSGDRVGESSESIRARVQAARNIQLKRLSANRSSDIVCNANMHIGEIRKFCKIAEGSSEFDAVNHEPAQFIGGYISPHPKTGPHGCRSIGKSRLGITSWQDQGPPPRESCLTLRRTTLLWKLLFIGVASLWQR